MKKEELRIQIDDLLNEFGIPRHLDGYSYIETTVELRADGTVERKDGAMYLYQKVARAYEAKRSIVERSIRYAVEYAFNRGDIETVRRYFGNAVSRVTGRATNKQFIETVVIEIERRMK